MFLLPLCHCEKSYQDSGILGPGPFLLHVRGLLRSQLSHQLRAASISLWEKNLVRSRCFLQHLSVSETAPLLGTKLRSSTAGTCGLVTGRK